MRSAFTRARGLAVRGLLGGLLAWATLIGVALVRESRRHAAGNADVIVVLGAAVIGDKPSPVFEGRLKHALELLREGRASRVILTGARSAEDGVSESLAGRRYLVANGVSESAISIEEISRTTRENLVEARRIMTELGIRRALVVSDPLHMLRSRMMWERLGMDAQGEPTPFSRYRGIGTRVRFGIREFVFLHGYWITGQ